MPEQPKTKEIPRVDVPSNTVDAILVEMRAMRGDVQDVKGDVETLVGNWRSVSKWRGEMEEWRSEVNAALSRNSQRAKEPSAHDLETAKALSEEVIARQALAKEVKILRVETNAQTQILKRVDESTVAIVSGAKRFFGNPVVRVIASAIGGAFLTWLANHGFHVPVDALPH